MGLFSRRKEEVLLPTLSSLELEKEEVAPVSVKPEAEPQIIGLSEKLVNKIETSIEKNKKEKAQLKEEKRVLESKHEKTIARLSEVEGRCDEISKAFQSFKEDLGKDFLTEARKTLLKDADEIRETINTLRNRMIRMEDRLIDVNSDLKEIRVSYKFHDLYQSIKLLIYMIAGFDVGDHKIVTSLVQAINSIALEMRDEGYWESAKDAVITSLLEVKNSWRDKDPRITKIIDLGLEELKGLK